MLYALITPLWVLLVFTVRLTEQQSPVAYYMDSADQCNKKYDIGRNQVTLRGKKGGTTQASAAIKTCQMTFVSDDVRENRRFRVEVLEANFQIEGPEFYIYDSDTTDKQMDGFGYLRDKPGGYKPLFTTKGLVTFMLAKTDENAFDYNIRVSVVPIAGGVDANECDGNTGPGCNYYFTQSPITKEIIIGIVGGVFGLIIFIIVPLVVICCYRKSKGVNRRWDEFKLSQSNTAADISASKGSVRATSHDTKSRLWASQSSKAGLASMKHSLPRSRSARFSEEDDSVFDDLPPKNYPPPPPPYERYDRNELRNKDHFDGRRKNGRNDWNDSNNYHFDRNERRNDNYDKRNRRNYRDEEDDYDRRPRREMDRRQRDPPSRRSYHSDSNSEMDSSFVQAEDDHPQETFVERIIEPRVKPKSKVKATKVVEEDVYDELSEDVEAIKESGVQCEPSDDEDESNTETTDEGTTDSESESENEKKVDPRAALYSKPNKKVEKSSDAPNSQPAVLPSGPASYPNNIMAGHPNFGQPVMGQPMTMMRPPTSGIIPGVVVRPVTQPQFIPGQPYGQPSVMRPGIPVQPFRPVQPSYPVRTGLPNPQPVQKSQPPQPQMTSDPPQDRPTYSYLVQRGYKNGYSPASSVTGTSNHSDAHVINLTDDSDVGANLQSGVDLMKRTTDV